MYNPDRQTDIQRDGGREGGGKRERERGEEGWGWAVDGDRRMLRDYRGLLEKDR